MQTWMLRLTIRTNTFITRDLFKLRISCSVDKVVGDNIILRLWIALFSRNIKGIVTNA